MIIARTTQQNPIILREKQKKGEMQSMQGMQVDLITLKVLDQFFAERCYQVVIDNYGFKDRNQVKDKMENCMGRSYQAMGHVLTTMMQEVQDQEAQNNVFK